MKRWWMGLVLVLCGLSTSLQAQMGSVPYVFTAGTVITASQVNTNFSTLYSNALNRTGGTMTGTLTTLAVLPTTHNTYDFGVTGTRYRDGWFGRNVDVGGTLGVTGTTTLAAINASSLATTGAATVGTTLNVTGATTLGSSVSVPTATPIYFDGGSNTYIYEHSADVLRVVTGGIGGARFFSDSLSVPALGRVYLDDGSNTYIHESSSDTMQFVTGGSAALTVGATFLYVPPTSKFYLDGGSNTYITEASADLIQLVTGATQSAAFNSSGITTVGGVFSSNVTVGGTLGVTGTATLTKALEHAATTAAITCDGSTVDQNINIGTAPVVRLTSAGSGACTLGGLTGGVAGQIRYLINASSQVALINEEDTSSTAANRFDTVAGASYTIYSGGLCIVVYNGTTSRWVPACKS